MARGWNWMIFKIPSHLKHSMIKAFKFILQTLAQFERQWSVSLQPGYGTSDQKKLKSCVLGKMLSLVRVHEDRKTLFQKRHKHECKNMAVRNLQCFKYENTQNMPDVTHKRNKHIASHEWSEEQINLNSQMSPQWGGCLKRWLGNHSSYFTLKNLKFSFKKIIFSIRVCFHLQDLSCGVSHHLSRSR